jgi:hypothetical protein
MVVAFLSTPARDQQPPSTLSASPAAPGRTVCAVLPHTALRHRSSSGMRRRSAPSRRAARRRTPVPRHGRTVVASCGLGGRARCWRRRPTAGGRSVDVAELACRVAPARVHAPPPQHGVEVSHHLFDRSAHVPPVRPVPDLCSDRVHRSSRWPAVEVMLASPPPRLPLAVMEAEAVESLPTSNRTCELPRIRLYRGVDRSCNGV